MAEDVAEDSVVPDTDGVMDDAGVPEADEVTLDAGVPDTDDVTVAAGVGVASGVGRTHRPPTRSYPLTQAEHVRPK